MQNKEIYEIFQRCCNEHSYKLYECIVGITVITNYSKWHIYYQDAYLNEENNIIIGKIYYEKDISPNKKRQKHKDICRLQKKQQDLPISDVFKTIEVYDKKRFIDEQNNNPKVYYKGFKKW